MHISANLYVVIGIVSTALAQIFLKIATANTAIHIKWILFLLLSLISYAVSFLSYYMALKYFDISKVQPVMMVSIVSIIALYGYAVGENFNSLRLAGVLLAMASIFMIAKS
jgi:uncharacterized membrane protein